MVMVRLLLFFVIFICMPSYSHDESWHPKTYDSNIYYYLSTRIPDSVRQISYDTDYCNVYLSFALTKNEITNDIKDNIKKYCATLSPRNGELKKKYASNSEVCSILTMTDDVVLLYHDYDKVNK